MKQSHESENYEPSPIFGKPHEVKTMWGKEIIYDSNDSYCFKTLHYNKAGDFSSFHAHAVGEKYRFIGKMESWYVSAGSFQFNYLNSKGIKRETIIKKGDVIRLPRGCFHQLTALEDNSEILEASTKDDQADIFRIAPGMNQIFGETEL